MAQIRVAKQNFESKLEGRRKVGKTRMRWLEEAKMSYES
jgi:hypothetical protein